MANARQLTDGILRVVTDNLGYFRQNPPHLAWTMMHYELLHRAISNAMNPKDRIIEISEKLTEDDGNLIYDAWGVTVSNYMEFSDVNPNLPLEGKRNKTLDEWVALLTDSRYRHSSLYEDEFSVRDSLLCTIGTGMNWNKDGFITHTGPSGVDQDIFAGYTKIQERVRPDIRGEILRLAYDKRFKAKAEKYMGMAKEVQQRIEAGEDWIDAVNPQRKKEREERNAILKRLISQEGFSDEAKKDFESIISGHVRNTRTEKRKHYPLSEYSNLVTMPENAHESYVVGAIKTVREIMDEMGSEKIAKEFARRFLNKRTY